MKTVECPREQDVLDAVASARWPDRLDAGLAAHIRACSICADLVLVAHALSGEQDAAWREAAVPPSGQVWWRAEMRAREEAMRAASQPLTVAEGLAGALALVAIVLLARMTWPWIGAAASSSLAALPRDMWVRLGPLEAMALGAVGILLVVAPVAFYLALSDE